MRKRRHESRSAGHVNVTPMIDVVMCLIIFYLLVGQLASQRAGKIDLPDGERGISGESGSAIVINVVAGEAGVGGGGGAGGVGGASVLLGSEPVDVNDLAARLAARAREIREGGGPEKAAGRAVGSGAAGGMPENAIQVQVRADRSLTYGQVQPILSACRDAGLLSVRLVTDRAGGGSGGAGGAGGVGGGGGGQP